MPRVEAWLEDVAPDVLCMQETKLSDAAFPTMAFSALGYESAHHGQGQWNGVAILSKVGLDDVVHGFADGADPDADARLITATLRWRQLLVGLRAQRPRRRTRPLPLQAGLVRPAGCPPGRRGWPGRAGGRDRRLQRRPRGPRRLGPEGLRGVDARDATRARGRRDPGGVGARGRVPSVLARRQPAVHLLGLPRRRLPPAPRHAHRPRAGHQRPSPSG